jgi:hypothetical protein
MPGTFAIKAEHTFATALLMSCAPRIEFGGTAQDRTATGLPKWSAEVAVTFLAEPGAARVTSEVISVTIAAEQDPAAGIAPGTVITFDDLRLGISAPEARDNGRVRGGRPWFQAGGIRPAASANGRPLAAAKSEG